MNPKPPNLQCYANGDPYRPVGQLAGPILCLGATTALNWSNLWTLVQRQLSLQGYQRGTRIQYRQILRKLRIYSGVEKPGLITTEVIQTYLHELARQHCSASWISTNISVCRTIFDKLGGMQLCTRFITPKRPLHLPEILTDDEIVNMIKQTPTLRDRLIIGLLYGCGLRVGELCHLRWQHVDIEQKILSVHHRSGLSRQLDLPHALLGILQQGVDACAPHSFLFPGAKPGAPLSTRTIERMVKNVATTASVGRPVSCMTLRHAYAIQCVRNGTNIRALQQCLGHKSVKTTLRYQRCIPATALALSPPDCGSQACHASRVVFSASTSPLPLSPLHPSMLNVGCSMSDVLPSFSSIPSFPFPTLGSPERLFIQHLKARLTHHFLALRNRLPLNPHVTP